MKKIFVAIAIVVVLLIFVAILVDQITANMEARVRMRQFNEVRIAHDVLKAVKLNPKFIPSTMAQNISMPLDHFPPPFNDATKFAPYYLVKTSKGLVFYRKDTESSRTLERLERTSTTKDLLNLSYDLSAGTTTDTWKMVIISPPSPEKQSLTAPAEKQDLPGLHRYLESAFD